MEEKLSRRVFRYYAIPQKEKRALVNKYNPTNRFEEFVLRILSENLEDDNVIHSMPFLYRNPNISVEFILDHPNIFNQNQELLITNPNYVEYAQNHGIDISNMYLSEEGCGNPDLPLFTGVFDTIPDGIIKMEFIRYNRYLNLDFLIEEKVDEKYYKDFLSNPNISVKDIRKISEIGHSRITDKIQPYNFNLSARDIYELYQINTPNTYININITREDYFILISLNKNSRKGYNPNLNLADISELFNMYDISTEKFARSPMLYEQDVFGDENSLLQMTEDRDVLWSYWMLNPNINFEEIQFDSIGDTDDNLGNILSNLGPYDPVKFKELYLMDEENKSAYRTLTRLPSYKNMKGVDYLPLEIRGHIGKFLGVPHDSRNYNVEPLRELKRHGSPVRKDSRHGSPVRDSPKSPRNPRRSPFRK